MKTPPAMQALVDICKLDPKPGDEGTIVCPRCMAEFKWWKEQAIGKLSGGCGHCGLKLPRG